MKEARGLRELTYKRYEYTSAVTGAEDTIHTGNLLTFVYDIPHFDACGVCPPFHIANQSFSKGRAGGGMSPGTSWEPFTISLDEYSISVEAIQHTPISEIRPHARYAFVALKFDHSLDSIGEWLDWFGASCKKHRESRHEELRKAGAMS